MNNYEFSTNWAIANAKAGSTVLDFGCGSAKIVAALRDRGVEAYGCDTYFDGGDFSAKVPPELLAKQIVRRMPTDAIPFDDQSFDLIVSNFVMEHVPDLERSVSEMARVIKPGGMVLSLFPDRGVWYEGHSKIPFLHKFAKGTTPRVYYMAMMSLLGFGKRKGRERLAWCRWTCEYLDKWTYFRPRSEIHSTFGQYFDSIRHIEEHWFKAKLGRRAAVLGPLPSPINRFLGAKLGTSAFTCRRHP